MVVKKFNYFRFFIFLVILVSIIIGVVYLGKTNIYKNSYEYKLLEKGYSEEEVNTLVTKYDDRIDK